MLIAAVMIFTAAPKKVHANPGDGTSESTLQLGNIIGNAVKYTLKGKVTVTSYVERDTYIIRVSDTGIGISAEDQKKLFTRFYRVKSKETDSIRGTGLGLWITRNIINQMEGNISVESIKGKGTDFVISFPIVQTA